MSSPLHALIAQWREKGEHELSEAARRERPAAIAVASMRLHCADELEALLASSALRDEEGQQTDQGLPGSTASGNATEARHVVTGRRRCGIPEHRKQIKAMQRWGVYLNAQWSSLFYRLRAVEAEKDGRQRRVWDLQRLLKRIDGWDHLDTAADGLYWRREIQQALAVDGGPLVQPGTAESKSPMKRKPKPPTPQQLLGTDPEPRPTR